MSQKNLGRWIEELDASIERLQKRVDKIVAGGGFDPSAYVYDTSFIDLSATPTLVSYSENGSATYTATDNCMVVMYAYGLADGYNHIRLTDGNLDYPVAVCSAPALGTASGVISLKAGQTLYISNATVSDTPAFKIYPIIQQQLQEAPVGLLGRIARTVKKAIKGGD